MGKSPLLRITRLGLSLTELLVVTVVLALLIGLAFFAVAATRRRAWSTSSEANIRQLGILISAYSADFRIATHDARLGMPEIKLGWPPGYGIAQLTALVGKARALEMCLMGDPITAERALQWGLVHEVVASSMLMQRGLQLAQRLLQLPAEALRATKRLVHLDEGSQPKVAYRADTDAYVRCLQLDDAREGIQAFVDKRPPKFRGF